MPNEAVTQEQFYEFRKSVDSKFDKLESRFDKLEDAVNKLRTWTVSAFFGAVVVIGTLIGAYAMFLLRLP